MRRFELGLEKSNSVPCRVGCWAERKIDIGSLTLLSRNALLVYIYHGFVFR